jgi:SRSO17 transposase
VWKKGEEPLPPKQYSGRGRPAAKVMRRAAEHQPISVKDVALNLPASAWRKVTWREGAAAPLSSRFARVRVGVAHRDYKLIECRPEEWLLIEWPKGEKEPTEYWFSTLPEDINLRRLVDYAKLRWRIEHDYLELIHHHNGRSEQAPRNPRATWPDDERY